MKKLLFVVLLVSLLGKMCAVGSERDLLGMSIEQDANSYRIVLVKESIAEFSVPPLQNGAAPAVVITEQKNGWRRVRITWETEQQIEQSELSVEMQLLRDPDSGGHRTWHRRRGVVSRSTSFALLH